MHKDLIGFILCLEMTCFVYLHWETTKLHPKFNMAELSPIVKTDLIMLEIIRNTQTVSDWIHYYYIGLLLISSRDILLEMLFAHCFFVGIKHLWCILNVWMKICPFSRVYQIETFQQSRTFFQNQYVKKYICS